MIRVPGRVMSGRAFIGVLGLSITALLSPACNFFLAPPQPPEQREWEAQVKNFHVVQTAAGDLEARVSWLLPEWWIDPEERVDTVHIVFQKDTPPLTMAMVMPPPYGGIIDVSRQDNQSAYRWTVGNIPPAGTRLWYAMFARSRRGWYAPVYDTLKVQEGPGTLQNTTVSLPAIAVERRRLLEYDISNDNSTVSAPGADYTLDGGGSGFKIWGYLRFDLPEEVEVDYAELTLAGTGGTAINVYPLQRSWFDPENVPDARQNAVDPEFAAAPVSVSTYPADITAVVSRAVLHGTNAILLEPVNSADTVTITFGSEQITMDYYSFD
jgi:hypothetical protein